jgi:S1-C subfamily serine protease
VNVLDLFILLAAFSAALGGYRLGFMTRAASWFGMGVGLFVGARILPDVLEAFGDGSRGWLLVIAAAVLIGTAFAGQAIGMLIGSKLHLALPDGGARSFDRGAGAAAGLVGVIAAVWLLLPAMASVPDWPARLARNSTIAQAIDDQLPAAPDTLQTLRRLLGEDQFVQVFSDLQPAPDLGPPPAASGMSEAVADQVATSTFKVKGIACSRIQEGSGFAVGPDLVVTNAHVVAGEDSTEVVRTSGGAVHATVVAFDSDRDLAVLRVPDLQRDPLPVGDTEVGGRGAVFGYPGGGNLERSPFEVAREVTATGRDLYHAKETQRRVFFLSAELRPGDSGGALVDPGGQVVGVAFAIAPDRRNVAYALTTDELRAVLDGDLSHEADTGPCLVS